MVDWEIFDDAGEKPIKEYFFALKEEYRIASLFLAPCAFVVSLIIFILKTPYLIVKESRHILRQYFKRFVEVQEKERLEEKE